MESQPDRQRERRVSDRARLAGHERSAPDHPLRGRSSDDAHVRRLVDRAVAEGSGVVLLRGRSGIGKTRLLATAIERADAGGWSTVIITPDIDSSALPLAALLEGAARAVPPLLENDAVTSVLRGTEPGYRITRLLTDALQSMAVERPVLFVVDDAQWLDTSSLTVLASLIRSLEGEQIAWLFATRTGAYRAAHARLIDRAERSGGVIDLQPLTRDAAVEIAADLLGTSPGPVLTETLGKTAFIPLLIVELVRGLREEGMLETRGLETETVGTEVPGRFGASSRERLTHLSPNALRLIQVGSLIGRRFRLVDALAVLGMSAANAAPSVEELITQEVLVDDGQQFAFLHDSLREGAEATVSPSVRRALGREVVRVRLSAGESPAAVASVLIDSAEPGDEQSFALLRAAALTLAPLDAAESSRLAVAALNVAADTPRFAFEASDLIPVLWAGGHGERAHQATLALAPHLSTEHRARTLLTVARQQTESSFDDAIATIDEALRWQDVSRATRAELLAVRALNAANKADFVELRRSLDQARAAGDPGQNSRALATIDATESVFEFYEHHWDHSLALIARAFQHAEHAGVRPNLWMPEGLWPTFIRNSFGETATALALIESGLQESSSARSTPTEAYWMMVRSRVLYDAGRLDDARLQAETVLNLADELGIGDFAHATAGIVLFKVALNLGDSATAESTRPLVQALADGTALTRAGRWALAVEALDEGRLDDAYALSSLAIASLREPIPSMSQPADFADDLALVEILLAAGDGDAVNAVEGVATRRADDNPEYPLASAIRDAVRGRIHGDEALIEAATQQLRGVERPLVRARVLELMHLVSESPERAKRSLEEALRIYEAQGAARDSSRVLAALRARGVHRRPARAARTELLSAREAQVLDHLVRGATTQQIGAALFVSPHTVVSHIRHIYAKLGVNSRKELVARHAELLDSSPGSVA